MQLAVGLLAKQSALVGKANELAADPRRREGPRSQKLERKGENGKMKRRAFRPPSLSASRSAPAYIRGSPRWFTTTLLLGGGAAICTVRGEPR